jgi:hypothetical protein
MPVAGGVSAARGLRRKRHPLTDRLTAAIITNDAIDGEDGCAAGGVTDDACGATAAAERISLGGGGSRDTKNSGGGKDGEECFHGVSGKIVFRTL